MKTIKEIIIHLSIVIGIISLILLSFEIYLRINWKKKLQDQSWRVGNIYQEDNKLIYALKSNSFRIHSNKEFREAAYINNEGFRKNNNTSKQKSNNTYRIIAVGDSFTFGHGLNESEAYPDLLERNIQNQYKIKTIEVLNAGVPGYGPDQEYSLIINKLIEYNPDLIIWNLTSYDYYDMTFAVPSIFSIDNKGKLITLDARKNWLYIQDKLLIYTPKIIKNTYLFDFSVSQLSHLSLLSGRPNINAEQLTNWAYTKLIEQIDDVNKISQKRGFKLLITRLPTKAEFNNNSPKIFNTIFTKLSNYLHDNNISYIDLSDDIKKNNLTNSFTKYKSDKVLGLSKINTEELFYRYDGHPNPYGSVVISSILSNYINDKILSVN